MTSPKTEAEERATLAKIFAARDAALSEAGASHLIPTTALSARASAGEGGEWVLVPRDAITAAAAELSAQGCKDSASDLLQSMLTAAPQPAQAGASGGGEDWRETERLRLLKLRQLLEGFEVEIEAEGLESPATYLDRVTLVGRFQPSAGGPEVAKRIAAILAAPVRDATPASPATCPVDVRGCEGPSSGIVCKACLMAQEAEGIEWTRCVFHGAPPHGYQDWLQWTASSIKSDVFIRAATADDWTPPASGDGEGDQRELLGKIVRMEWMAWAREQPNPKPSWLLSWAELSEPEREVDRRIGERIYRMAIDGLHTTRPTPEAQEARDGDTKRLDWLDGFTCASEYRINEYFGSAGRMRYVQIADRDGTFTAEAQSLREAIDAAMELDSIDAALALPAQGEEKS